MCIHRNHRRLLTVLVFALSGPAIAWSQGPRPAKRHTKADVYQRFLQSQRTVPKQVQPLVLTPAEWKRRLTKQQFYILRQKGTERKGSGQYLHHKAKGTYVCSGCGHPLFESKTKFDSGTGWPSFYGHLEGHVKRLPDVSHGMNRTEIVCARCDGHLGHVFPDGPPPTGERHCVNSVSLRFIPE